MSIPFYGQNKDGDNLQYAADGKVKIKTIAAGLHTKLTADDSGSVVIVAANSTEVTLPDAAEGLNFKFIFGAHDSAICKVITAAADDFVGSINANTGAGDIATDSDVSINTGTATVAGDYVSVVCDGTDWFIVDSMSSATTNGMVFA